MSRSPASRSRRSSSRWRQRRAEEARLSDRVRFLLCDYRDLTGQFDRIVSVGMFEHVGVVHYRTFFNKVRDRLADAGVALLHSIGRPHGPGATNPWIRKYIFPGGYVAGIVRGGAGGRADRALRTDIEILRLHYADTLRAWRTRFMARRDEALKLYDERFCRMWEFYLAGAEMAFRHQGQMVFQMQMAKRVDTVPLMRDYIARDEQALQGMLDSRGATEISPLHTYPQRRTSASPARHLLASPRC